MHYFFGSLAAVVMAAVVWALPARYAAAQDEDFAGADVTLDANTSWGGRKLGIGTLTVPAGVTLSATGRLEIRATSVIVEGAISADGAGEAGVSGSAATGRDGVGPGAGGRGGATLVGGGGAGFGGAGGRGGRFAGGGSYGGAAGPSYGGVMDVAYAGSSGGSGGGIARESPGGSSGAGGGLLLIFAETLTVSGSITADGAGGGVRGSAGLVSGGGGGSGGGLVLSASRFDITGVLSASGGAGGSVSCSFGSDCSGGGGGGGGRVLVLYADARPSFEPVVAGGARGTGGPTVGESGQAGTSSFDHVPSVIVEPLVAGRAIDIAFSLRDAEADPCEIEVLVMDDAGARPATVSGSTRGLESSPLGVAHTLTWDAASDLPAGGSVTIRVRARDPYGWGPPTTLSTVVPGPLDAGAPDAGPPADAGPERDASVDGATIDDASVRDSGSGTRARRGGGCDASGGGHPLAAGTLALLLFVLSWRRRGAAS